MFMATKLSVNFKKLRKMLKGKKLRFAKLALIFLAIYFQALSIYQNGESEGSFVLYTVLFSSLAAIFTLFETRYEVPSFLLSTFCIITSWRLSSLMEMRYPDLILALSFVILVLQFWRIIKTHFSKHNKEFELHSAFVRMFLGYDLIPHFSEKLFAGPTIREADISDFMSLGISDPYFMVALAGVIEFLGALAFSCGIFTKLSAVCIFIYLMTASYMGHHFASGFIWANPGGGWEYPVLWSCVILSFAFLKINVYSIDNVLLKSPRCPSFLRSILSFSKKD